MKRNPKTEIRSPKEGRNPNLENRSRTFGGPRDGRVRVGVVKALVKTGQLPFTPKGETEEDKMLGPIDRRREMLDYIGA